MLCTFWPFVFVLSLSLLRFEFVLRQLFVILAPAVLGRRDGSIRALRKRRSRNETDNFIESISQMVPRWSPEVPDGPQRSQMVPRGPQWSPKVCSIYSALFKDLPKDSSSKIPFP